MLHPARGPGRMFVQGANLAERNRGDRPIDSLTTGTRHLEEDRWIPGCKPWLECDNVFLIRHTH